MRLKAYDLLEDGRDIVVIDFVGEGDNVLAIVANGTGHMYVLGLDDLRLPPTQIEALGFEPEGGKFALDIKQSVLTALKKEMKKGFFNDD